jgi:hypothetical protein
LSRAIRHPQLKGRCFVFLQNARLHVEDRAATVRRRCPNCSNEVDFLLVWNKAGLGLGIPVVMWFTDATTITTHKQYHLGCPTCGYLERISRDAAKGLIAEGRLKCEPPSSPVAEYGAGAPGPREVPEGTIATQTQSEDPQHQQELSAGSQAGGAETNDAALFGMIFPVALVLLVLIIAGVSSLSAPSSRPAVDKTAAKTDDSKARAVAELSRRASAHYAAGEYDATIADCTEAIALDPKSQWAYANRGYAHYAKKEYDGAVSDLTEAVRLNPADASARQWRENALRAKETEEQAWESRATPRGWQRLQLGMTPAQVQELVGRPIGVETYPAVRQWVWRFPNLGKVEFTNGGVSAWHEPY